MHGKLWRAVAGALFFSVCSRAMAATELSTDWILGSIHDHHVTDIEGLLATFQPQSLKLHLLVYGSESQQFASFLSPRVIVYSYDADFIMTYNGERGSEGYNDLEILRFNHKDRRFIPEVIHFDPQGKAAPKLDAHPTVCANCHQKDIRPNWDPYFHWVGFYGSEDDNENAREPNPGGVLRRGPEFEKYKEFVAKQEAEKKSGKGRYRFLPPHPSARPNLHFNERVTCLNMKRFVRAFTSHPEAPALWEVVRSGYPHIYEIPPELMKRAKHKYEDIEKDTERVMIKARWRRINRQIRLTGGQPLGRVRDLMTDKYEDGQEVRDAASWRFIWEEILGEPFYPQVTSRHPDYYLNLGGLISWSSITAGGHVDDKTGKIVIDRQDEHRLQYKDQDYNYWCSQADHVLDLPLIEPRDARVGIETGYPDDELGIISDALPRP